MSLHGVEQHGEHISEVEDDGSYLIGFLVNQCAQEMFLDQHPAWFSHPHTIVWTVNPELSTDPVSWVDGNWHPFKETWKLFQMSWCLKHRLELEKKAVMYTQPSPHFCSWRVIKEILERWRWSSLTHKLWAHNQSIDFLWETSENKKLTLRLLYLVLSLDSSGSDHGGQ